MLIFLVIRQKSKQSALHNLCLGPLRHFDVAFPAQCIVCLQNSMGDFYNVVPTNADTVCWHIVLTQCMATFWTSEAQNKCRAQKKKQPVFATVISRLLCIARKRWYRYFIRFLKRIPNFPKPKNNGCIWNFIGVLSLKTTSQIWNFSP